MRSLVAAVAALALALSAAACGGGAEAGAGGQAAAVVPAGAALYVSGNTDFEGDQWQTAADLVRKFPDGEKALAQALSEFESEENVDFEQDVKPALGPEVAFVVLDFPTDGSDPAVVALTQPDDEQKLQALLEKGSDPTVSEQVEGWTVVSDRQSSIDRFKEMRSDGALADSDDFGEAMDGLEGDSLVSLYVNGEALDRAARSAPSFEEEQLDTLLPGGEIPSIGAVARAEDDGARIDGQAFFAADVEGSAFASPSFEAKLPDEVPAGVLAYISFNNLEKQFSTFRDALAAADPAFESQLGQAEGALGVSLEEDLAPLFAGEGALYFRQGGLIPEITLVTTVEDEQKALATVDDLVAGLGSFIPVSEPRKVDIEGVEAREVPIQPPFALYYATFDGKLVITSARSGISDLRGDHDRFADEEGFAQAKDRAGLPDETTGFAYVNLEEVVPLVLGFAGGEVPPEVGANTDPLRSLVAWGTADGRKATFSLFVGIE